MRTDRCFGSSLKCRLHTERLLSRSSLVHAGPRARNIPASAERLALPRCSAVPRRLLPNLPQRQLQRPPALTRLKNVRLARSLARALDQSLTLSRDSYLSADTAPNANATDTCLYLASGILALSLGLVRVLAEIVKQTGSPRLTTGILSSLAETLAAQFEYHSEGTTMTTNRAWRMCNTLAHSQQHQHTYSDRWPVDGAEASLPCVRRIRDLAVDL